MLVNYIKFELGEEHRLARADYIPRVFGFAAAFVVITLLVLDRNWSYWYFPFMVLSFLIYPHVVLFLSKAVPGDKRVELRALMFESFLFGFWVACIEFFLWESYTLFAGILITNTMIGGFPRMFKALALFVAGALMGGLLMGFDFQPGGPFYIEFAAMVSLLSYVINAAATFFSQTRRLAGIRNKLEEKNNKLNNVVQELKSTRNELVSKAHKAGMADLATGVLHNIGNILNSVNISTAVIEETLQRSKIPKFNQANELLVKHKDHLEEFLLEDPRGMKLMDYYQKLGDPLEEEYEKLNTHCNRLIEKVQLMLEVIDAQQEFAKVGRINEKVQLRNIVEDTLTLQAGSIERHGLRIQKDFHDTDKVIVQKSKLIHILVNLVKNAKEAMAGVAPDEKLITIRTYQDEDFVYLSVSDSGDGIKQENIQQIFKYGFTTKQKGHGYGLHTCANYMAEMKGKIEVTSEGVGKGATFTISIPRYNPEDEEHRNYEVLAHN